MLQKIFFALYFLILTPSFAQSSEAPPLVIVSVAPYKFIVDKIADGSVEVFLIVPAGTSAHTFEPGPKDMIKATRADAWFTLGEVFEKKAINAIAANNKNFKVFDLTQGVDLIQCAEHEGCCHCCHGSADLHIWLSPKELKVQAGLIAKELTRLVPDEKEKFEQNLSKLETELGQLDQRIRAIIGDSKQRHILVSHPAFGYFCRDYGFKQISIEVEGKDPTPKKMHALITLAKTDALKKIFVQPQYSDKAAYLIAGQIGAQVVVLDPYKESLFDNLIHIAEEFSHD